jgi:RNA polymerase sigma-70 factor (ECF subfamily)
VTNDSAFEALYQAHHEDLLRYALRRVDQPEDAADAVAETWTVAWRRREDLPPAGEQRLWLFGVARKALANQRRGRLRQSRVADRLRGELSHWQPEAGTDPAVGQALRRLRPADRDVLVMHAWEDLTSDQIASVLGCSNAAARVRLHRARKRLRNALAAENIPDDHVRAAALCVAEETR